MKKGKVKYTAAPRGVGEAIRTSTDVTWAEIERMTKMPSTSEIAAGLRTKKTSIGLTEYAIEQFKKAGEKESVPYQQLIREVLHWYAQNYLGSNSSRSKA